MRTERLRHQGLPPEPAASSFTSAPLLQRTVKKGEYKEDITDYSRLGLSNGSNGATAPVAGLASPARFYDPDITTHREVRGMFLDSRWQRSAGSRGGPATDDKIYAISPTHTAVSLAGVVPLGIFLVHSGPCVWDAIHISVCNALPSDLETLQPFLLQEFKVFPGRFIS